MEIHSFTMPTIEQINEFFNFVNRAHDGTQREQIWIELLKTKRRLIFTQQKLMDTFDITREQAVQLSVVGVEQKFMEREGTTVVIAAQKTKMILDMIIKPGLISEEEQEKLDEAGEE